MSGPDAMPILTCDEVREMAGAYVLGALEPAEEAAVRSHLDGHADAHPEITELGSVIPALAEVVPQLEPPAGLKDRIMAAAAADLAARDAPTGTSSAARLDAPGAGDGVLIEFAPLAERATRATSTSGRATSAGSWLLGMAAVLAIALLGGWNLLLQNQLGDAQAYERNVAAVLDAAAESGSLTAVLTAGGATGSGLAAVQPDGDLTIAMRDLAPTTGSSVYEAWVIGADRVPVPVGSFTVGDTGTGFLQAGGLPAAEGITLALTLESGPGATVPTMPIISSGVAGAPG